MMYTTTFRPGIFNATYPLAQTVSGKDSTVMELAVTAVSPDGVPLSLIPLYKLLYSFILKKTKYDIKNITKKALVVAGSLIAARFIWDWIKPHVITMFTSSVTIRETQKVYPCLQEFLAKSVLGRGKSHLKLEGELSWPRSESGWFWYGGQLMYYENVFDEVRAPKPCNPWQDPDDIEYQTVKMNSTTLYCFGSSTEPIMRIWKSFNPNWEVQETEIYTLKKEHKQNSWHKKLQPDRPLSTIDLEQKTKDRLVTDIKTFASPGRDQWYANRGIPYRRGYLFHGPPGTGKSSTAKAIAAKLKSSLYIVSMNEIENESTLKFVFKSPRKGDVLLLEDIDSAGIVRENMVNGELKKVGVSLSGLLNAIDGACAAEGIILILTSNNPESLDAALVRPGRIDVKILFGYVDRAVAESVFLRMYQDDAAKVMGNVGIDPLIKKQAGLFAAKIPDQKLTPAEVQTFLTQHAHPAEALEKADEWIEELLKAKAAGKNIVGQDGKYLEPVHKGLAKGDVAHQKMDGEQQPDKEANKESDSEESDSEESDSEDSGSESD